MSRGFIRSLLEYLYSLIVLIDALLLQLKYLLAILIDLVGFCFSKDKKIMLVLRIGSILFGGDVEPARTLCYLLIFLVCRL